MDRFERGDGVAGSLLAPVDAPQGVVADRVAAVEVPHAVGAVVGGGMPLGLSGGGPARPGGGAEAERPELVECEHPVREALQDVLDPVELGNQDPNSLAGHGMRTHGNP
jgi:hypothetical protein